MLPLEIQETHHKQATDCIYNDMSLSALDELAPVESRVDERFRSTLDVIVQTPPFRNAAAWGHCVGG